MTSARQERRMRGHAERPPLDREAVRYFVYTVADKDGNPVYIGRSCNVAARLRAHAGHQGDGADKSWLHLAASVSLIGPFAWAEACRVERVQIEKHQPVGNVMFTKAAGWAPVTQSEAGAA